MQKLYKKTHMYVCWLNDKDHLSSIQIFIRTSVSSQRLLRTAYEVAIKEIIKDIVCYFVIRFVTFRKILTLGEETICCFFKLYNDCRKQTFQDSVEKLNKAKWYQLLSSTYISFFSLPFCELKEQISSEYTFFILYQVRFLEYYFQWGF